MFGHHYAHRQENKSVHCRIWCSALVVLAVVVWSWDASCVHCDSYCSTAIITGHGKTKSYLHRFNPLNAELNPIRHLLALLGAHHILHVSRIRVKSCV